MAPLRIGVNALYLIPGGVGGTEIYLRSLLHAMAEIDRTNTWLVFTNRETGTGLAPRSPNFEVFVQPVPARVRPARIVWEQLILPFQASSRRLDVLFNPGFTGPAFAPCPSVTVFHDLQHKRHPEYFRWFDRPFWRFFLYLSAMRSRALIAVSETTRQDLLAFYRLPRAKVHVVPHGVDPRMFEVARERNASRLGRYLLCVSTLHPHKNIDRLLHAFQAFRREQPEFRLVLAGLRGFHTRNTERLVRELDLGDAVEITGWIPRQDLYRLFREAWAFIYPSTFEGFGMPVVEALAAGVPVACSAIEPLSTISGAAALHFDPESTDAIRDALVRVTSDEPLRSRLAVEGPLRAAGFNWREAAARTLEVLVQAAGG